MTIYVIDGDEAVRRSLQRLFPLAGLPCRVFDSPAQFLSQDRHDPVACVLLDLDLPEAASLEAEARLYQLPVVCVGAGIRVARVASAMRRGALDFLAKPFQPEELLRVVEEGLAVARRRFDVRQAESEWQQRYDSLSQRERQVCHLVAAGLLNREIGSLLDVTVKTVKVHRGRAMGKLQADSVPELVHMLERVHSVNGTPVSEPLHPFPAPVPRQVDVRRTA